jgi:hypothetical protein
MPFGKAVDALGALPHQPRSTAQRYAWQAAGLWEAINFLLLQ